MLKFQETLDEFITKFNYRVVFFCDKYFTMKHGLCAQQMLFTPAFLIFFTSDNNDSHKSIAIL